LCYEKDDMKDFYSLFIKELKNIYDAEKQILKALPEMAKSAHCSHLKEAFHQHLKETKLQITRLEDISQELNEDLSGTENEAVKSLLKEGQKIIKSKFDAVSKDAALINAAQHIEHYEIASYGTLKAFAKHLKFTEVFNLLDDTSKEEGIMNKTLTSIAEGSIFQKGVNDKACEKCA
jgi:ferritin-like metal-binding protein YciE